MALRGMAAKMQVPVAYATLSPRPVKSARDRYLIQRAYYDNVTQELTNSSREVVRTERIAKLLDVTYTLGVSYFSARLVVNGIIIWNLWSLVDRPPATKGFSESENVRG